MDWVLELRSPAPTLLFRAFTHLGSQAFFLLFLPVGYWFWRKPAFARVGALLLVTALLNAFLKELWQAPRPDIAHLTEAHGWSFPSGHAQVAGAMWAWLAWELRTRWAALAAALLIAGVSASRVYLGVHFPIDVVAGAGIGLATALGFGLVVRHAPSVWRDLHPLGQAAAIFAVLVGWLAVFPGAAPSYAVKAAGALTGFWTGVACERRWIRFGPSAGISRFALAIAVGLGGVVLVWIGLKSAFAALGIDWVGADFVRYGMIGAWVGGVAPWLFVRLGWFRRDRT